MREHAVDRFRTQDASTQGPKSCLTNQGHEPIKLLAVPRMRINQQLRVIFKTEDCKDADSAGAAELREMRDQAVEIPKS